ncbi:MAG: DUF2079 domain-containing protein [Candidatus Omnitrophota bacterium]
MKFPRNDFLKKIINFIILAYLFFFLSLFITDYSFIHGVGFTNISGFTALLLALLFIRWMLDKKSFGQIYIFKKFVQLTKINDRSLLVVFFLLITFTISALSIVRHLSFSSMAWDMGAFDQAFWNTLQGNIFFSSLRGNISLLGDHFEPILFLIVPFYALWRHVFTLLIIQALLLGSSVFPLYLIAKHKLKSQVLIFAFITSFALSKAIRGIGLSDFHPEAFIVPLCFLAFYALTSKKNLLFILSIFFILACKETSVFVVIGFGIYAFFALKRKLTGLLLIILAIFFWFLETKLIIPSLNDSHTGYYFYNRMPFGSTYQENLVFVLKNPLKFISFIFIPEKISFCIKLFGLAGFCSFFAPAQYILFIVPLFILLLGTPQLSGYYSLSSHYVAFVLPFVYISSIYGAANLIEFIKRRQVSKRISPDKIKIILSAYIIIISLFFYGKTDAYKFRRFIDGIRQGRSFEKIAYLSRIPKDASVSASANLVPHLSGRKYIFEWNPETDLSLKTDYIVIDTTLVDYMPLSVRSKIPEFFNKATKAGYKKVFQGPSKTFFIFFNPDNDNSSVVNYRWNN